MPQIATAFCLVLCALVASARLAARQEPEPEPGDQGSIVYESFHIESTIVARYAITRITSAALNSATVSRELSFNVQLPDTAFISNFTMIVNGTTYVGIAQEKERALQEFENRQQAGENVGLVESRGTNLFGIRINTAASSRSTFVLEYEELILRRFSAYQQVINLNPGSLVEDFQVTVRVVDQQGIATFSGSDFATASRVSEEEVLYRYSPTVDDQNDQTFGLSRDLAISYDVNHPEQGPGLIVVNNCYFAHFFSPSGVDPIPVDIVFVIDVSGSMSGRKIEQARDSLVAVIGQLRAADRFSIVTFETSVSNWRSSLVSVAEFREAGADFARGLMAGGGTNFAGGLEAGVQILLDHGQEQNVQLVVMLTDGEPTVGTTDPDAILALAGDLLADTQISLNTLGFGAFLNFDLLLRLALANRGLAQRIFEGEDAADQLESFYEEISSPILSRVTVTYPEGVLDEVSEVEFPLLFGGSELVVAGRFEDSVCEPGAAPISVTVSGTGATSELIFQGTVSPGEDTEIAGFVPSTERLVAYLNIRQLLDRMRVEEDEDVADMLKERALMLSLQYNFVTELTSLIVVQEDQMRNLTSSDDSGNDSELEEADAFLPGLGGGGGPMVGAAYAFAQPTTTGIAVVVGCVVGVALLLLLLLYVLVPAVVAVTYTRRKGRGPRRQTAGETQMSSLLLESVDFAPKKKEGLPGVEGGVHVQTEAINPIHQGGVQEEDSFEKEDSTQKEDSAETEDTSKRDRDSIQEKEIDSTGSE